MGWSREQMAEFIESSPDLLGIANQEGYFVALSPSWERTLGYSLEELTSKPYSDFMHPDDRERTRAAVDKLSTAPLEVNFRNTYLHKDGSEVQLDWRTSQFNARGFVFAIARPVRE